MHILLTGATGYIGQRLLPVLLQAGHHVHACVRDKSRFSSPMGNHPHLSVVEVDFLDPDCGDRLPEQIDAAYYLIHSMSAATGDFALLEKKAATHAAEALSSRSVKQVIYLSGIVNEATLSKHLASRKQVESILSAGNYPLTTLRAGIIVGSGSASFEIIRDLVEKLPFMIAPRWLNTRSQPIAISNTIEYLHGVLFNEHTFDQSYDIGGPDILTYKEMLLQFASVRGLKRHILTVPVMTPKLSSYWLYFVTSTSFSLASTLVNSMNVEVVCRPNTLDQDLNIKLLSYREAVRNAFDRIGSQQVISSWTDALSSPTLQPGISALIKVPTYGCFIDHRERPVNDETSTLERVWSIGGENGWYYGNRLWELRGFLDKLFGGVGLRRGRKHPHQLHAGETLDFWRVLFADQQKKRLLLYAEMKLPGEAWLEFHIKEGNLHQTATFRPKGLLGRLYWYSVYPFHGFIFNGMLKKLTE